MTEYSKKVLIKSYVAQAMLEFALKRIGNITYVSTDEIAEDFTNKILEELK